MVTLAGKLTGELSFLEIIIGIILALILVALWQRSVENFIFGYLGLNSTSAYQTFIAAISFTIIFFIILNIIDDAAREIILGETGTDTNVVGSTSATADEITTICQSKHQKSCDLLKIKQEKRHLKENEPVKFNRISGSGRSVRSNRQRCR